ncbi:MAG TPA: hypothetical protein VD768_09335 [Sphingomicrobium sp.]|nr:hypothetical protein [Sphingomicrobium sp.]
MPWAGLVAGMGGAGLAHQVGSEGMFNDCAAVSPGPILIVSLIGLALTAAGAFASLRVYREKSDRSSRHLIATVSLGLAALFAMAILLPMVASLVIPPCYM